MGDAGDDTVLTVTVEDGVATLLMRRGGVNLVDERLLAALDGVITALDADDGVLGAVLVSADDRTFLAGGDVASFLTYTSADEVVAAIERGATVLARLAAWRKPLVAAVDGACLGGGTELVLAARQVVASDSNHTRFALPEVKLGLLPGLGGCVRLPQRVGLLAALDIIVTGRNVYPREALARGLVDLVVPRGELLATAVKTVRRLAGGSGSGRPRRGHSPAAVVGHGAVRLPLVLDWVLARARARTLRATHGNYPAAVRACDVLGVWARRGARAGERASARVFAELLFTREARALIGVFFAQTAARKNPWRAAARPVQRLAVVGAGLMGTGIAEVSAAAGVSVRLKDATPELAERGHEAVAAALAARAGKGMTHEEAAAAARRVTAVAAYEDLSAADATIEAALEDVALKRAILAEVERVTGDQHLFASNTSAIRIEELAAGAQRPEAVVGMHYFSPVQKMPLLEVVVTRRTAEWAVATATALGLAQGKSVIVVLDGPGFYTTRVLSVYLAEAIVALREGVPPAALERAVVAAGFPLGPLALMDDVGIDTGAKIEGVLAPLLAERGYRDGGVSARLAAGGFTGRKGAKGFYLYDEGRRSRQLDVRAFLAAGLPLPPDDDGVSRADGVARRLLLTFVREAVTCLADGVLRSARDGDVGAVLGLGFPAFLGGPFTMLDALGPAVAVQEFEQLAERHGERLAPPDLLREVAAGERGFRTDVGVQAR